MDLREFISHKDVMVIADCESDINHYLRYQNLSKGNPYVDCQIITPIRWRRSWCRRMGHYMSHSRHFDQSPKIWQLCCCMELCTGRSSDQYRSRLKEEILLRRS